MKNGHNLRMNYLKFTEKLTISPVFLIVFGVFCAFFTLIFACFLRKNAAFFACGGAFFILFSLACGYCRELSAEDFRTLHYSLAALYFLLYAAFLWHLRQAKKREERREKFAAARAAEEYVLPERGNGYVREKLREAAAVPAAAGGGICEPAVELRHARELLKRLKKAALSVGDRLEAERLEDKIGAFENAPELNAELIRELSDSFSAVLKLSAKYML